MHLKVLGCSGGFTPQFRQTTFLLDKDLLLDGGTINSALRDEEMTDIRWCLVSHAHLDHIREIAFLLHTKSVFGHAPLTLVGHDDVLKSVREHILNGVIWPDFSVIGDPPYLRYQSIECGQWITLGDYQVRAEFTNHKPATTGFFVKKDGGTLAYSSDISLSKESAPSPFVDYLKKDDDISNLIVEATFPDRLIDFANMTLHSIPAQIAKLKQSLQRDVRVLITHMRPVDIAEIKDDFAKSGIAVEFLEAGIEHDIK